MRQLDSEACYSGGGTQYEFCAPSSVTTLFLPGGLPPGVDFGSQTARRPLAS